MKNKRKLLHTILLPGFAVIFLLLWGPSLQAQAVNDNCRSAWCGIQSRPTASEVVGHSVMGQAIKAFFWGRGKRYVYILGAIHGDESNSNQLVERTRELLEQNYRQKSGKVTFILIPCMNPDGACWHCRTNANNVDLNRNFPGQDFNPNPNCYYKNPLEPMQPEIRALLQLCKIYPPVLIYSIHQPMNLINYDGPAAAIALDVQCINGMRIVPELGYATPGSLGEYFGKMKQVPVITLELPHTGTGKIWEDCLTCSAEAIILSALHWQACHTR